MYVCIGKALRFVYIIFENINSYYVIKDIIFFKEDTFLFVQKLLTKFIPIYYWYEVVGYGIYKKFNLMNIVNPSFDKPKQF